MAGRVSSTLQSTPAATCLKILLTTFNFIFWVSGIAVLALGIWMKVELHVYVELTSLYYSQAPYVLIGVGAAIVIVGSLGCCCTIKGNSFLLYLYAGFLMVVFVVELALAVSLFVYKSKVKSGFETGLGSAMKNYTEKKKSIDGLQQRLKCCGLNNYTDWFDKKWDGDKTKANSVPTSCCMKDGCKNYGLPVNIPANSTLEVYTQGCYLKVTDFMQSNFAIVGGVAIGFSFLQLFGSLIACCLAKIINKAKYEQVA